MGYVKSLIGEPVRVGLPSGSEDVVGYRLTVQMGFVYPSSGDVQPGMTGRRWGKEPGSEVEWSFVLSFWLRRPGYERDYPVFPFQKSCFEKERF